MSLELESKSLTFNPRESIERARKQRKNVLDSKNINSSNDQMNKINLIRSGLHYDHISELSKKLDIPVKQILDILNIPQTTYNKKKKKKDLLDSKSTELVILLNELADFGYFVFNNENDKFYSWLKTTNHSLNDVRPIELFDSYTGIQEVYKTLERIEYGNMA